MSLRTGASVGLRCLVCGIFLAVVALLGIDSANTCLSSHVSIEMLVDIVDQPSDNGSTSGSEEREEHEDMLVVWNNHATMPIIRKKPAADDSHRWSHPRIITPPPEARMS